MPPTNLAELIQAAAKQEQERIANQIAEANEKLVSVAYDKAATYTTVIIFGGYAGLFAIWQLTREYLTKEQALWSALLRQAWGRSWLFGRQRSPFACSALSVQ